MQHGARVRPAPTGSVSKPDAFALMMRGSKKKGGPEGRGKRERDGRKDTPPLQTPGQQGAAGKLHAVGDARREMAAMGFQTAAVERALQLHAHGALVDLAVAVAACISLSDASEGAETPKKMKYTVPPPGQEAAASAAPRASRPALEDVRPRDA